MGLGVRKMKARHRQQWSHIVPTDHAFLSLAQLRDEMGMDQSCCASRGGYRARAVLVFVPMQDTTGVRMRRYLRGMEHKLYRGVAITSFASGKRQPNQNWPASM